MKVIKIFFVVALMGATFTRCADDFEQPAPATGQTIVDIASSSADFNILTAALVRTGLAGSLDNVNSGIFTVFVPTDQAFIAYFNSLPASGLPPSAPAPGSYDEEAVLNIINNLLAPTYSPPSTTAMTPASLAGILNYHIIASEITANQVTPGTGRVTLQSGRLSLSPTVNGVVVNADRAGNGAGNGTTVVAADIQAANGVIHQIGKVLVPITLANIWAGGTTGLPGFTVNYGTNPPTISYFGTAMPRNPDGSINVGSANVGTTENQLISMLIIRGNVAPVIIPNQTPLPDFTLFAPRDQDIVTALGAADEAAARAAINALSPQAAADIVNYHLVKGRFVSTDFTVDQVVTTMRPGKTLTVKSVSPVVLQDGLGNMISVSNANVLTNAGVLHQISGVLATN